MTILALGQLLADVIQNYMDVDADRVILTDEGFDAPKDSGIYILVIYDAPGLLGIDSKVNTATNLETMSASSHERFNVEVVSRGRDATSRHKEVLMAVQSIAGTQAAEVAGCAFFRGGNVLNLTGIEGVASLRRYQIPIIITNVESKTDTGALIDKFKAPTINTEAK